MTNYKLLLIGLFLAVLMSGSAHAQDTTRIMATWRVQKYDLDVTLPQDERGRTLTARAVLTLKNVSGKPASTLTLRLSPTAEVSAVKINDSTSDFNHNTETVNPATSFQRVIMRLSPVAPDSIVTAAIEYKFTVKNNSGLAAISPSGSQFLPLSYWYPTPNSWFFAQGADVAPVSMKVHSAMTAVSAGSSAAGGFAETLNGQPFFITGNWEESNQSGTSVFMPKGSAADAPKIAAALAAIVSDAKVFMTAALGQAPDVPVRIVSSRRGAGFASGGVIVVSDAVFRRSKVDSLTAMNIAEGMAKLWIGNSVSVTGDGYGTISEGLTRYLATQFIENKYGKDVADVERTRQRVSYAAVSKRDAPMATVSPLDDYYYPEVANKGAMAWRILAKRIGTETFWKNIRSAMQDGDLNLAEFRITFAEQKSLVDYLFDRVTDMNLLAGVPQITGTDTKVALRNTGTVDAVVDVAGTAANGERMVASTTLKATSFGEIIFRSPNKIVRVEVDADKMYPQIDYSDDVAPRESTESDPLLTVKRLFDKQDFAGAEAAARTGLRDLPRHGDMRILLGRALLAEGKTADAEREFHTVLDEMLPTSRSLAWANEGLADIAARAGQSEAARKFAEIAILAEGEYGAGLAARNIRSKLGSSAAPDAAIRSFFADFDKAASSNRKADVDALVMPGEVSKFAGGVSGGTERWQTEIRQIDRLDADTVLVEANMTIKLLNREQETGLAVYRLERTAAGWRLAGVDMFETR